MLSPLTLSFVILCCHPTSTTNSSSNTPWIVSLIIGLLTVAVNLFISWHTRKVTLEVAGRQLETSREISKQQFIADLNTKNRQDWINQLRDSIAELLSQCMMINAEYEKTPFEEELANKHFQKVILLRAKIIMMLNPDKPDQQKIIDHIESIVLLMGAKVDMKKYIEIENALILDAQNLFGIHWSKIKSGK